MLKWDPRISVFLGITDIIFGGIFGNSYYMKSLQMIDKILFDSFDDFCKHGLHIVISVVIRNGKTFHLFCIFYHYVFVTLCVFTLIARYSILIFCIPLSSFLTTSRCCSIYILKVKFPILQMKMEDQIWSPEQYRMKNYYNKKNYLDEKKVI